MFLDEHPITEPVLYIFCPFLGRHQFVHSSARVKLIASMHKANRHFRVKKMLPANEEMGPMQNEMMDIV